MVELICSGIWIFFTLLSIFCVVQKPSEGRRWGLMIIYIIISCLSIRDNHKAIFEYLGV